MPGARELLQAAAVALGVLGAAAAALAGAISVSPVRIELTQEHPIATLQVRNDGSDRVTMQLERVAWTQRDGTDDYTASSALIATPTVFELPPHGVQILRVALRETAALARERAFRVYACEVPSMRPSEGTGLQMALRIGVPIFAETAARGTQLDADIHALAGGKLAVRVRNSGPHYAHAIGIELSNGAGAVLWRTHSPAYLLAGGEHVWSSDEAAVIAPDEPLRLSVITESGVERIDTHLEP
jgi:fimbrial chaperone protein